MKNSNKKPGRYEWAFVIAILILALAAALVPETGSAALLNELCQVLMLWLAGVYVMRWVIRSFRQKGDSSRRKKGVGAKVTGIAVVVICLGLGVWFGKDIVLDVIQGPETTVLTDIQVYHAQGYSGIFSNHYTLIGVDDRGEKIQLEISADDYSRLSQGGAVTVRYYRHTGHAQSLEIG